MLLDSVLNMCHSRSDKTFFVGYSGGLDSHVLLHLMAQARTLRGIDVRAVHINHQLSSRAHEWEQHCKKTCENLQIPYQSFTIQLDLSANDSLEAIAREKRYSILSALLKKDDVLLTAHHQDDQAETLLLQLVRGAGPKGLAAMPTLKSLGQGFQARPLLLYSRAELKKYAIDNGLHWIEDESNERLNFSRNFIRHEILPLLKKRWPSVTGTLARVSTHCAEAQHLLEGVAKQDLLQSQGRVAGTLSIQKVLSLDSARQRQLIRQWIKDQGFLLPSAVKLNQIQTDVLLSASDKVPVVSWKNCEVRRYLDDLYILPPLVSHNEYQAIKWDRLETPLEIPNVGMLKAVDTSNQCFRKDIPNVSVQFRIGGEQCQLPGRQCHHRLKNLMQEWKVPTWRRDRLPLIYVNKELVAVVGYYINSEFVKKENCLFILTSLKKKGG